MIDGVLALTRSHVAGSHILPADLPATILPHPANRVAGLLVVVAGLRVLGLGN